MSNEGKLQANSQDMHTYVFLFIIIIYHEMTCLNFITLLTIKAPYRRSSALHLFTLDQCIFAAVVPKDPECVCVIYANKCTHKAMKLQYQLIAISCNNPLPRLQQSVIGHIKIFSLK